jgi:cell division protein FtsZ
MNRSIDDFQSFDQRAVIKVCGVGGGGGNAVQRMIDAGLDDVDFVVVNTDAQALKKSTAPMRLQIGVALAGGLGAGADPSKGREAAKEDRERIAEAVRGADMIFLTTGLGGGTGTGASPVVAEEAKKQGALTVAIVTLPFSFEGPERMENALRGLNELEQHVDTLIVVPNDRVAALCQNNNMPMLNAFKQADEVLDNGVRAISELITVTGLINVDFADVRTIMQKKGRALMGIGVAEGDDRAVRAAEEAIVCPLLEQSTIHGARGVIVNVKGGCDIGMREMEQAVRTVKNAAHPDANIIFGAVVDDNERAELQVTVIAAGFEAATEERIANFIAGREQQQYQRPVSVPDIRTEPEPEPDYPLPPATESAPPAFTPFDDPDAGEQIMIPGSTPAGASESPKVDMGIPTWLRNRRGRRDV